MGLLLSGRTLMHIASEQPVPRKDDEFGYYFLVGMLSHPDVKQFVRATRERDGISPPEDEDAKRWNLEHHPPETYETEAFRVVRRVWQQMLQLGNAAFLHANPMTEADLALLRAYGNLPPDSTLPPMLLALTSDEDRIRDLARSVARYVVIGLLEIPEPFMPLAMDAVRVVGDGEDAVVFALATPATNLEALIRELRRACREQFGDGTRRRLPELAEKCWFHFARKVFRQEGDHEGRMDKRLAELSFTISPERRPDCDPASPEYEAAENREADRIRRMLSSLPGDIDRMLGLAGKPPAGREASCEE
jgi:hypothetical protein